MIRYVRSSTPRRFALIVQSVWWTIVASLNARHADTISAVLTFTDQRSSLALMVIFAFSTFDTGHPAFALSAAF